MAAVGIAAIAWTPGFLKPGVVSDVLLLGSVVGVMAVGQAFVLIGGGFDLSQGRIVTLSAAVAAWLAATKGVSPWAAGPAALAVGFVLGSINGFFVAAVNTNPFVTTLSTQLIYRGAAFAVLGGLPIERVFGFVGLNAGAEVGGLRVTFLGALFLAVAAAAWVVLRFSVFGRHLYAVGGNVRAARLSGLPTIRLRVVAFGLSGMAAGLAAVMYLAYYRVAKPDVGQNYELDSIAACVVGGVSLQGGSGSVIGAALGCLLLQALGLYLTISGFPDEYRSLAVGAVILTFAAADALARRS